MIGAIAYLAISLGCTNPPPEAPTVAKKSDKESTVHWELVGRVTPNASRWPDAPPFEGGKAMIERCRERRPCAAERWRSESGDTFDVLLRERTLHFEDGRPPWPARWLSINGVLRSCMGDPLTIPPTDDPAGVRTLETQGDSATWAIHLSGTNSCGLVGQLRLNAKADTIDLGALRCEAKKWFEGGKECARAKKKAALAPQKVAE